MRRQNFYWFSFGVAAGALIGALGSLDFLPDRSVSPTLKVRFTEIETIVTASIFSEDNKPFKEGFSSVYSELNFKPKEAIVGGKKEPVTFLLNPDFEKWSGLGLQRAMKFPLIGAIIHGETNTLAVYYSDRHIVSVPCGVAIDFSVLSNKSWTSKIVCPVNPSADELDKDVGI